MESASDSSKLTQRKNFFQCTRNEQKKKFFFFGSVNFHFKWPLFTGDNHHTPEKIKLLI